MFSSINFSNCSRRGWSNVSGWERGVVGGCERCGGSVNQSQERFLTVMESTGGSAPGNNHRAHCHISNQQSALYSSGRLGTCRTL